MGLLTPIFWPNFLIPTFYSHSQPTHLQFSFLFSHFFFSFSHSSLVPITSHPWHIFSQKLKPLAHLSLISLFLSFSLSLSLYFSLFAYYSINVQEKAFLWAPLFSLPPHTYPLDLFCLNHDNSSLHEIEFQAKKKRKTEKIETRNILEFQHIENEFGTGNLYIVAKEYHNRKNLNKQYTWQGLRQRNISYS